MKDSFNDFVDALYDGNKGTAAYHLRHAIDEAFKPLLDELKRKPTFWAAFDLAEPDDFSRAGPPKDAVPAGPDPDELGAKPVDGLVTGAQLKTIQDQAWKAAGFALDQGSLTQTKQPDPNKLYQITDIEFGFVSVEEGEC